MNIGENILSLRCIIKGKVQGVFFRASTRDQAVRLNIKGYAKNLSSGDVEVIMHGEQEAITQLRLWLNHGPEYAKVENIDCKKIDIQEV